MTQFEIGSRVTVVREFRHDVGTAGGKTGLLSIVDLEDFTYPYLVNLAGEEVWVHEIQLAPENAVSDREALVNRAKELLTGTEHNGADVIAMAAFLSGA